LYGKVTSIEAADNNPPKSHINRNPVSEDIGKPNRFSALFTRQFLYKGNTSLQ
jgi:hypothetical protein